jgi:CRISPR-associated protein Csd2
MSLTNRYDFVLLFDVKDGNPNGDPDAGNLPRLDAETGNGLVTDVALKRKVRNFVALTHDQDQRDPAPGEKRFEIYVREKAILNLQHQRAYSALKLDEPAAVEAATEAAPEKKSGKDKKRKGSDAEANVNKARDWMCQNFFDVRTFGAVMSTGDQKCGQVRGPVQLTFARSIDPVIAQEHALTVCAARTEDKSIEEQIGIQGRKHTIPYGLYMAHGFVSAFLAEQTQFGEDDLALLWQALGQMFEHDRSAARGEMATRGLYVFKHESKLGNAPAHALFDRIKPKLKENVAVARSFEDYEVSVEETALPAGVTLFRIV